MMIPMPDDFVEAFSLGGEPLVSAPPGLVPMSDLKWANAEDVWRAVCGEPPGGIIRLYQGPIDYDRWII